MLWRATARGRRCGSSLLEGCLTAGHRGGWRTWGAQEGWGEKEVSEKEGKGREERIKRRKDLSRNYMRD